MKINKLFILSFAVCLAFIGNLQAASFNCQKAGNFIEHTICNDTKLSKLDDDLAVVYKNAMKNTKNKEGLKQQQFAWIEERNSCQNVECLQNSYSKRISKLNNKPKETPYGNKSKETIILNGIPMTYIYNFTLDDASLIVKNMPQLKYALDISESELYCDKFDISFNKGLYKYIEAAEFEEYQHQLQGAILDKNKNIVALKLYYPKSDYDNYEAMVYFTGERNICIALLEYIKDTRK